jgi:hypothetical protein
LPSNDTVPPLRLRLETTDRPVPALAMLSAVPEPVPIVTDPPETLNVPADVLPAPVLVFTAITRLPIVAVPPPRVTVAVAPPVPSPVRWAMARLVTSNVPWSNVKVAVAVPLLADRAARVMVPARMSAAWPATSRVPLMLAPVLLDEFTRLTVARPSPSAARIRIVPVVSDAPNAIWPLERPALPAAPTLIVPALI